MSERTLPNNRRPSTNFCGEACGVAFTYTVSFAPGTDRLLEAFIGNCKSGNAADNMARESGLLLSLALQYGAPAEVIRHAMPRDANGKALGPVAVLLDLLAKDGG